MNTVLFNKNLVNTNDDIPGNNLVLFFLVVYPSRIDVVLLTPNTLLNSDSSSYLYPSSIIDSGSNLYNK